MNLAWIPNSITMGNLLFGFFSIVFASRGEFAQAGFSILFAALLDGLDGQVARVLKVSSKLGAELDSLADCVTFGVAPGYLVFNAYLSDFYLVLGQKPFFAGMVIAVIFPICAAYRLARFNVVHEPASFSGLPSPIAGIVVALLPIAISDPAYIRNHQIQFVPAYILIALLMVSTVKFSKPQAVVLKKIYGIRLVIFTVIVISLCFIFRKWIMFILIGLIAIYIISGLIMFIIQFIQDHRY
ncbi:MAG: CDP-diacylglycerol--serine O-phosphatidyltransferase [Spirochaetes bacterium]|nr:CDP-diacylglycerol--serine O-phosphatidyltransferase [Spirochaetota bacterium]